jgi:hypothetical protein
METGCFGLSNSGSGVWGFGNVSSVRVPIHEFEIARRGGLSGDPQPHALDSFNDRGG